MTELSPWQTVLGSDFSELDPALQRYFARIPEARLGVGAGVFEVAGTRLPVLRLLLLPLRWLGVIDPRWGTGVPFRVQNRQLGAVLSGRREFQHPRGGFVMHDRIAERDGRLVDRLGRGGVVEVALEARVHAGALEVTSRAVVMRLGRVRVPIPASLAPRFRLTESSTPAGRQRVEARLDAPLLGRLHEYRGEFDYALEDAA